MTDIRKLSSLFDAYAYGINYATAFTGLLDAFLLPFKICDTKEQREAQLQQIRAYPRKNTLAPLLEMLGALSEGFCDPLGQLYMEKLSTGHMGQHFTPEHVCDLMAQISIISSEPGKTVLDLACGSGRMLLAAAKIDRHLLFYGADLDKLCCKMALANMLVQSLTGEIAHMNSLSNEFFTGYRISTRLHNGYHYPCYREFINPEESAIWLRPRVKPEIVFPDSTILNASGTFAQGTLF